MATILAKNRMNDERLFIPLRITPTPINHSVTKTTLNGGGGGREGLREELPWVFSRRSRFQTSHKEVDSVGWDNHQGSKISIVVKIASLA